MRKLFLLLVGLLINITTFAETITGKVIDKTTRETLPGATIVVVGTTNGVITDFDGNFSISEIQNSKFALSISFVGYKTKIITELTKNQESLIVELEEDSQNLEEVRVVAKKVLGSVLSLNNERINSILSIENLGEQEMSMKGLSSVKDGVKKMTGITFSSGQLFVRGLGDRYSSTTLNGLPIASPNPDNKIIPLELFPSSTISNITVSKVFQASTFADYSGAHINIDTRENTNKDFLKIGISAGGQTTAISNPFFKSDISGMLKSQGISQEIRDMNYLDFREYAKTTDIFGTSFNIKKQNVRPNLGLSLSGGKTFEIGEHKLNVLLSGSIKNEYETTMDAFTSSLNDLGNTLSMFNYDSYTQELETAALAGLGYYFSPENSIHYTLFYTRSAEDNFKYRDGFDAEDNPLIGTNNTFHSYSLLNNQLSGRYRLNDNWSMNWSGSYSMTKSDEPDRKQVMYRKNDDGTISIFALNARETMRYYASLNEDEIVGDFKFKYELNDKNSIHFGATYKDKSRDYISTSFFYDYTNLNPTIKDIYSAGDFITQENIANGNITIKLNSLAEGNYYAGSNIIAGFVESDYNITDNFLMSLGLRYEKSNQWVKYWLEGSNPQDYKKRSIDKGDIFPGLNLKYNLSDKKSLRLTFSKTVTRPSFVEMAPFRYEESYGSQAIRGNAYLQNGYNYNFDLRYEIFSKNSKDMLSLTTYYKHLDSPIERVQSLEGMSIIHSFRNVNRGKAFGFELEMKRTISDTWGIGVNGSYMYTNVNLGEEVGIYTDQSRALQGAAPYLINGDVICRPLIAGERNLSLSLLYNYEAARIDAVGILGMNNIIQEASHNLNFVSNYKINDKWNLNLKLSNLLNQSNKYSQEINNEKYTIGQKHNGIKFSLGASLTL